MDWLNFKVELAIRLSLQIYHEESYVKWANSWLDGSDRSPVHASVASVAASSYVASVAADASYAASYAADAAAAASSYAAAAASADISIKYNIKAGAKLENVVKFL